MPSLSIPIRQLGTDGPTVPALGLGLMLLAGAYGEAPGGDERSKFLDRAHEVGSRFWDTSDMYGDNEEMIGKWFERTGKRDDIFLATKFGIKMEGREFKGIDSSAEYCKSACEASLKKLGIESIDLYYTHRLNPETPVEETMRAMAELKAAGKIKSIGLSEPSVNTLLRAYKVTPIAAIQIDYSPLMAPDERITLSTLVATCRSLGVAIVCSSPLGRGLLTGTITSRESITSPGDLRANNFPRFSDEHLAGNISLVDQFKVLADKKGCTLPQLVLAWLMKQGEDIIPIPGTKRIEFMEQNWGALQVKLDEDEDREVREFVEKAQIEGYKSTPAAKKFDKCETKEES
ncbi:putative aldo/keto reductase [Amniculicola lignicola CBS 123094]|uniref:Putative aldo/keto reductase n=1 Tax=Amniculicola lignicola CBS 123094 TaxID=1392246 RepID=A0A6A5WZZ6_9PLEO|nr:putative aldo/keto reductase [Amniculicola lignicola CBS 123094]